MGGLLVIGAALAAAVGYLYGSYLLLRDVLPPVLLAAALLGAFLGAVLGIAALLSAYGTAPANLSPQRHRTDRTPAAGPGPDPAWPLYGVAQARCDVQQFWTTMMTTGERPWRAASSAFFGQRSNWRVWWFFWPVPVVVLLVLSTMSLTGMLVCLAATVVAFMVSAVVTAGQLMIAGILRAVEWAWQKAVGAEAFCPYDYFVSPRPAYRCKGCEQLHRDVRPGRLGVLTRRCECGALHPTMVLRADGHFSAVCQRCESGLKGGAATVRDVRVPIFGDVSAGKTRFLYAALDGVSGLAGRAGLPFGYPTEDARREAERALQVIRSGGNTTKTSAGSLPTALTCSIGKGVTRSLVHLLDAAGEQYVDAALHDQLSFLQSSRCLVFVVDPFAVPGIRDRAVGVNPAALAQASASAGDVELLYTAVVNRIRDSGVKARGQRLAVVVSKADLLMASSIDVPTDSAAVALWLSGLGLHNVVLSARQDFVEVRYFTVHSTADGLADPGRSVDDVIRWVLATSGVRLPTAQKEVTAS